MQFCRQEKSLSPYANSCVGGGGCTMGGLVGIGRTGATGGAGGGVGSTVGRGVGMTTGGGAETLNGNTPA